MMKRMKKIVVAIAMTAMVAALSACGGKGAGQASGGYTDVVAAQGEVGKMLSDDFTKALEANAEASAQELADAVLADKKIPFAGMTMEVENGVLSGFGNAEITGFEQGVMFSPMIGTIPFVGYVFVLPEGADVTAFTDTLQSNADLRWNICTEADEMVIRTEGNRVFFLMCPLTFEEG